MTEAAWPGWLPPREGGGPRTNSGVAAAGRPVSFLRPPLPGLPSTRKETVGARNGAAPRDERGLLSSAQPSLGKGYSSQEETPSPPRSYGANAHLASVLIIAPRLPQSDRHRGTRRRGNATARVLPLPLKNGLGGGSSFQTAGSNRGGGALTQGLGKHPPASVPTPPTAAHAVLRLGLRGGAAHA